jgi:hypothetical protein
LFLSALDGPGLTPKRRLRAAKLMSNQNASSADIRDCSLSIGNCISCGYLLYFGGGFRVRDLTITVNLG